MKKIPTAEIETQLLALVHQFLSELEAERAKLALTLDAALDKDLGLGSLERAELFHRIEKNFEIKLPTTTIVQTETLRDLVTAIEKAGPAVSAVQQPQQYEKLEKAHVDLTSVISLIDVLAEYAKVEPDRPHIYLQDDSGKEQVIRYGQLFNEALAIAKGLQRKGIRPGETVAIMLPTSAEFFYAFFGILMAGGIPVPIYPPFRPKQIEEYAQREAHILSNAQVRILITFQKAETLSKLLSSFIPTLKEITTVSALQSKEGKLKDVSLSKDDAALIQYTSGSTGNPKGVLLTHFNLISNIKAYGKGVKIQPSDAVVSWLPLYHDMGLIGTWLGSLYYGLPVTIMSPLAFLSRPESWLWSIHYHRATLSGGPNFAFELCVKKIDDKLLQGLDLSSWRLAFNGAEAIYPNTIENFTKKFARYGFKPEAFFPVYGLAESSVALSFPEVNRLPKIDKIARQPFQEEGKAIPFRGDAKNTLEFVSCGKALPEHEIRILDDEGKDVPERVIGNLYFRGPSSMQGYYRNPEATQAVYKDGWWDSGDLAYIAEGELYITGRRKDVIIKAGRNLYPAEVEEITSQIPGVRKGCVAAFGVRDPERGTEKFIVVAETREQNSEERKKIIAEAIEKINSVLGLPPDKVILVPPHTIPKTSSGKLRRSSTMKLYLAGKLEKPGMPAWMQITKLFAIGQTRKIRELISNIAKVGYTSYVALALVITLLPLWPAINLVSRNTAAKLLKIWAKTILLLTGCSLHISGKENLPKQKPVIYVSNHASYVDAVTLVSFLPTDIVFIGKQELEKNVLLGNFMKRLNYIAVNRLDFAQSIVDAEHIQDALKSHRSIVIFPEGTFTYATGLRPFKLGAFKLAVETNTPIVPIALSGTRNILRGDTKLFRPGKIKITIGKTIVPQNTDWSEVVRLRNSVRAEIAKHCGEPSIDLVRAGFQEE